MKLKNIFYLFAAGCALGVTSCQDDPNDWNADSAYDRLFRPTTFKCSKEFPTAVSLLHTGVTGATKYVFEISRGDSLLFNNIVYTEEVMADTMTVTNNATAPVSAEYIKVFNDLDGTTRYSVRMKAVDEINHKESKYAELCFDTPDEQIFTLVTPGITSMTLNWQKDKQATRLQFAELIPNKSEEVSKTDTLWLEPHELTAQEIGAGEYVMEGLKPGTNYLAEIYKDDVRRGRYVATTLGSSVGTTIHVLPGDDVNALLAASTGGNVTLAFEGGQTYQLGELIIPESAQYVYLAGNTVAGKLPKLMISKVSFTAPIGSLNVQYLDVESDETSQFLIEIGNANCPLNIRFNGCTVSKVPRSIVRLNSGDAVMDNLLFDNCIIRDVALSGYGMLNIGKAKQLKKISFTKSTIWNMSDQFIDLRVPIEELLFRQVTFYNQVGMPKVFRLDKQPTLSTVTQVIWAGNNGGSKINSGNSDYKWLSFAGCYRTNDLHVDKYEFTDAVVLDITSDELFVDPTNGDFHFNPAVKFEGDGVAGDPRWWTE